MMKQSTYQKVVFWSGFYDLLVSSPLATPWTLGLMFSLLAGLDATMGSPGEFAPLNHTSVLLGNMAGTVIVIWSVLRMHLKQSILGRYDAVARFLFSGWMAYAIYSGASWLLFGFLIIELMFGVIQALPFSPHGSGDD